jgi:serine phosphatase RsbU (regulator of sigma subunit)
MHWLVPWGPSRALIAAALGIVGVAAIVSIMSHISGLENRPGAAMMGSLILVTVMTMTGGPLAGVATSVFAVGACAYYLARPFHSFRVDSAATEILIVSFIAASVAAAILVGRLAVARGDAEEAMVRSARLQRLTASLSRARTAEEVYGVILMEGREALGADAGMVALPVEDDTALDVVATFGFTPEELAGWERIDLSQRTPIGDAYALGLPIVLEDGEREKRFPGSGGRGAPTASVPLHTGERPIGALGFRFASGHRFSRADQALVSSLGDHCAQALERARLYDAEHRAREALALLATVGERLAGTLDPDDALRTLALLVVPAISDQCVVDLVENGEIRRLVAAHADPELQEAARALESFAPDLSSDTPVAVAIRTTTTQLVPHTEELPESAYRSPAHRAAVVAIGLRSMLSTPLVVRGRTIGALTFGWRRDHAFAELEIDLARQIARRVALALDNARLYDVQRDIAHTLQQSLLPGTLPQPPGIEIAARYRPSGEGAEVGGDFYDAWPLADGGFAIAIGDVAGKGPGAAALTALTRHAMKVAARYETSPSRILEVVNETILVERSTAEFCTAALALLRPDDDGYTFTSACAGHAPPLILRGATGAVEVAGTWGTLLGAVADAEFHDATTHLAEGDVVVCWTDGVTERRVDGDLFGEDRLTELVASLAGSTADTIAARIDDAVVAFAPGLPDDDVAILTLRLTGATAGRPLADRMPAPREAAGP